MKFENNSFSEFWNSKGRAWSLKFSRSLLNFKIHQTESFLDSMPPLQSQISPFERFYRFNKRTL